MKVFLLLAVVLRLQEPAPQPIAAHNVEGIVRLVSDNTPLPDATVGLYSWDGRPELNQTVRTNGSGWFMFQNVPDGEFIVRAEREGYLPPPSSSRYSVLIVPGADRTGLLRDPRDRATINLGANPPAPVQLYLSPGAIISGRITEESGAPVPEGSTVTVSRAAYFLGRKILQKVDTVSTGTKGEYSVPILPPSEYYISVDPERKAGVSSFMRTYYPGESVVSHATSIDTSQGGEIRGIDFQVKRPSTFKIGGKVINRVAGEVPNSEITFQLVPRDEAAIDGNPDTFFNVLDAKAVEAGKFELHGVLPGSYTVLAIGEVQHESRSYVGKAQVDLDDSDIGGLSIVLEKGSNINVQILGGNAPAPDAVRFMIVPAVPQQFFLRGSTQPNFLDNVPEGRYYLVPQGLQSGMYLADVRQDGRSVLDDGIAIGHESPVDVEVEIKSGGGNIEGVLLNAAKPLGNWPVYLVPAAPHDQNPTLFNYATTDSQGHFKMSSLRPGAYALFAWTNILPDQHLNPDFVSGFQGQGTSVDVQDGVTITDVSVKLIELR
jgi:hypothetical protein